MAAYSGSNLECVRFGARHGRESIGCCGVELMQAFVHAPGAKGSIQLKHGDSWCNLSHPNDLNLPAMFGPTNLDIFKGYNRVGTFSTNEVPNRVFLVTLTNSQVKSEVGKEWLKILHDYGFEFVRATANGVYSGSEVNDDFNNFKTTGHLIYIFGLFRNIGASRCENPFKAPEFWDTLGPNKTQEELHAQWLAEKTRW